MNLGTMVFENPMVKPTLRRIEQQCHFGGFCSECATVFIRPWRANSKESQKAIREQFLQHLQEHHMPRGKKLTATSAMPAKAN